MYERTVYNPRILYVAKKVTYVRTNERTPSSVFLVLPKVAGWFFTFFPPTSAQARGEFQQTEDLYFVDVAKRKLISRTDSGSRYAARARVRVCNKKQYFFKRALNNNKTKKWSRPACLCKSRRANFKAKTFNLWRFFSISLFGCTQLSCGLLLHLLLLRCAVCCWRGRSKSFRSLASSSALVHFS